MFLFRMHSQREDRVQGDYCEGKSIVIDGGPWSLVRVVTINKQQHVQDLYRWWFLAQCDRGRMRPIGRQWEDVVNDPRFQEI